MNYKLVFLSLIFWMLSITITRSQVMINAGYGYTNMASAGEMALKGTINPHMGIGFGILLSGKHQLYLQPEALYSRKGYIQTFLGEDYRFNFNYMALPVLLVWDPHKLIAIEGGVEFSDLSSTRVKTSGNSRKIHDVYANGDLGIVFGMQLAASEVMHFTFRYTHGMRDQLNYYQFDEWGTIENPASYLRNRVVSLSLQFHLTRR
jgi:hypothetical protein